ncbi:Zinc finger protein [Plakobranchus ocellatus]|uniref:Zinc finger protein n=1 Tax=Plakobranchus ocellatus TaxID=259542 RepID=A0AAV4A245_9GAST|nr:Zinc finger protein [Plakobranchus ocellatus]
MSGKKEEAERQERKEKEEANRKERLELEKMKLDAENKLLQAKIEAGIIKNEPDGSGARSSDTGAKHPKLPSFQDGKDDLDIWLTRTVDFLGHSLGRGAIGLQDENVEKVWDAPRPKTKREVRAFLGLIGYYKEFVPNFAAVSAPLSDLVRKGQPNVVNWDDSQERAYNSLKVAVTSKPVLQLPDVNKKFVLRTDASDRGLGAALMQENEGTLFPVAYASKKLTDRERKYSVTEIEALAIVWGVKKFSLYLYGTVFTLQTDHGALQFLNAAKFDSPRIMRWALALQVYNFDVQYIKGSENVGADYLSRIE